MVKSILFFLLLSPLFVSAKVELKSFYFDGNSKNPVNESTELLNSLRSRMDLGKYQIIEINAYSNVDGGSRKNTALSKKRVDFIVDLLQLEISELSINNFGNRRVELNFNPESWNRIDIYYNIPDKKEVDVTPPTPIIDSVIIPDADTVIVEKITYPEEEVVAPETLEVVENVPMILPILFKGGTLEILDDEDNYLDLIYNTMMEHKNLTAQIRGHVCCERNKRMSKLRAKVIYDYLIQKGIDKERLSYKGFSNKRPIVFPERTPQDRARNRRVEIIFKK